MIIRDATEKLTVASACLRGARFEDVDLSGATFRDVNLSGARLNDVNLSGVAIDDARLDGMTIRGVPVAELFAAWEARR